MSRTILTFGISMILSFAFLAACNGDDTADDTNGVDEDPVTETEDAAEEDEAATPEEDAEEATDEEATPEENGDEATDEEATPEEDAEEATDDTATPEENGDEATDDEATPEEDAEEATDDEATPEEDGEDTGAGATVAVTLSEDGIEMDSPIEAGTVELEVTNDGEGLHGIAIQEAAGSSSDEEAEDEESEEAGGAFVASVTVGAGETKTSEVELEAGEYIVFCPIGEHRTENEEEIELTVE